MKCAYYAPTRVGAIILVAALLSGCGAVVLGGLQGAAMGASIHAGKTDNQAPNKKHIEQFGGERKDCLDQGCRTLRPTGWRAACGGKLPFAGVAAVSHQSRQTLYPGDSISL